MKIGKLDCPANCS